MCRLVLSLWHDMNSHRLKTAKHWKSVTIMTLLGHWELMMCIICYGLCSDHIWTPIVWGILDWCVRQHPPAQSSKQTVRENPFGDVSSSTYLSAQSYRLAAQQHHSTTVQISDKSKTKESKITQGISSTCKTSANKQQANFTIRTPKESHITFVHCQQR